MRRVTIAILVPVSAVLAVWALLVSEEGSGAALGFGECGTVVAQPWTVKVQENIGVLSYRGTRYKVFNGSFFACSTARALVPRMVRTGTAEKLRAASFDEMACREDRSRWPRFIPSETGRVIAIRPVTARGKCGSSGKSFFWQPAVRRRS